MLTPAVSERVEAYPGLAHQAPNSTVINAVLQRVDFQGKEAARQNLSSVIQRVCPSVAHALVRLLQDCSNPDAALNSFERLVRENAELLLLERREYLIHYAIAVFANSQWLGETLIRNADLFHGFARERGLDCPRSREEFRENFARVRSRSFDTDLSTLLARFKRREYVRIALRDLLGIATLAETTAEISALSEVLIEEALIYCDSALRNRFGAPQHLDREGRISETPFTVLSLGKLGGNELNYSSDVDVLYLYGDGTDLPTAAISNREYFVRLAQELTELLSRPTREGSVFRIDLRLRPQGAEGQPAIALSQALRYYTDAAQDWELQALIKVRHSAGSQELAREFIRKVQPHVYRGETNFAAIDTALQARSRMFQRGRSVSRRNVSIDVKLDRGGIRDIEFLVQCLQRVYGGTERWLRSSGTLFSLQKLHDKQHISGKDFHDLTSTYEFLRKIEHRLQLRAGQQTHRLPTAARDLLVLNRSLSGSGDESPPDDLLRVLRERMQGVAEIYNRIIHSQQQASDRPAELHSELSQRGSAIGQARVEILERFEADSPELYRLASDPNLGEVARKNLFRFLGAARTSSERYAAITRAPYAIEEAIPIFAVSEYLTQILVRHPEDISVLEQANSSGADDGFHFASSGTSDNMAALRRQFRRRVLRSGARDILELRPVLESLRETSSAADNAIAAAHLVAGAPVTDFAVLALGRLGTREFDVLSDADLLFVRGESVDSDESARWAEAIIDVLAAYTSEGSVFPVDTRLRPHGRDGELVTTPAHLSAYFRSEAKPWEALTYLKLRHVSGDATLSKRSIEELTSASTTLRARFDIAAELRVMRKRLEESDTTAALNLKTSPGAIYDLDFMAGYLALEHGRPAQGKDLRQRLRELGGGEFLNQSDMKALDYAAELFRAAEHSLRLVDGRARKSLPVGEHALRSTERLVEGILRRTFASGLAAELRSVQSRVRQIYRSILRD